MNVDENLHYDQWLSSVMCRDVYRFDCPDKIDLCKLPEFKIAKGSFVFSKLGIDCVESRRSLLCSGFELIEANVQLAKEISNSVSGSGNQHEIRFAVASDKDQSVELAKISFTYSRFHQDGNISKEVANNVKGEWVGNYYKGKRGDFMLLALDGNRQVGFLQLLKHHQDLIIDLIAVDSEYRNRGIASDLIHYAEKNCGMVKRILVGSQLSNFKSLRMYENLGFRFCNASYVFHMHT